MSAFRPLVLLEWGSKRKDVRRHRARAKRVNVGRNGRHPTRSGPGRKSPEKKVKL